MAQQNPIIATKEEMAAITHRFEQERVPLSEAVGLVDRYQQLELMVEPLRNRQFAGSAERAFEGVEEFESVSRERVSELLRQFAMELATQLFPERSQESILDMVDRVKDSVPDDH